MGSFMGRQDGHGDDAATSRRLTSDQENHQEIQQIAQSIEGAIKPLTQELAKLIYEQHAESIQNQKAEIERLKQQQSSSVEQKYTAAFNDLQREKDELQRKKRLFDEEKKQLHKIESVSHKVQKYYGDNERSHEPTSNEFRSFFQGGRKLSRLQCVDNVDEFLVHLMQEAYNKSCETVLDKMRKQLQEILSCPTEYDATSDLSMEERKADTIKAYSVLAYHQRIGQQDIKNECVQNIIESLKEDEKVKKALERNKKTEEWLGKAANIAWDMVSLVPPAICSQPSAMKYNEELCELRPEIDSITAYDKLIYQMPVMFLGIDGTVGCKGKASVLQQNTRQGTADSSKHSQHSHVSTSLETLPSGHHGQSHFQMNPLLSKNDGLNDGMQQQHQAFDQMSRMPQRQQHQAFNQTSQMPKSSQRFDQKKNIFEGGHHASADRPQRTGKMTTDKRN